VSYWASQYLRAELQQQLSRQLGPALPILLAMHGAPAIYQPPQLPPGELGDPGDLGDPALPAGDDAGDDGGGDGSG
jgi:hypothetical protein